MRLRRRIQRSPQSALHPARNFLIAILTVVLCHEAKHICGAAFMQMGLLGDRVAAH